LRVAQGGAGSKPGRVGGSIYQGVVKKWFWDRRGLMEKVWEGPARRIKTLGWWWLPGGGRRWRPAARRPPPCSPVFVACRHGACAPLPATARTLVWMSDLPGALGQAGSAWKAGTLCACAPLYRTKKNEKGWPVCAVGPVRFHFLHSERRCTLIPLSCARRTLPPPRLPEQREGARTRARTRLCVCPMSGEASLAPMVDGACRERANFGGAFVFALRPLTHAHTHTPSPPSRRHHLRHHQRRPARGGECCVGARLLLKQNKTKKPMGGHRRPRRPPLIIASLSSKNNRASSAALTRRPT
jgi:hypothetical protein